MKNVLIVDDSKFILAIVEDEIRQKVEVDIMTAASYEAAKKLLEQETFHVAVLDVHLPDAQNGEVIDLVDEYEIPVIVLTGGMNEQTKKIIMQKEIIEYITKSDPKTIGYVASAVKRALSNYDKYALIVDDSPSSSKLLRHFLELMKLNVLEAGNGREALEIIQEGTQNISLVLTDYNMPEMNGIDLTMQLRQLYSKDQLSIIAISGEEKSSVATEFLRHGANDFIKKPYTFEEVSVRVNVNLELIDLFTQSREMANKDFLTGLFNRRYFFERSEIIFSKASRKKEPLGVVMLDIDHFKRVNDTYGHDAGDKVLKNLSNLLLINLRDYDIVARFGGEEFCILFEECGLETVQMRLEMIRSVVEATHTPVGDENIHCTVSMGLCYGLGESFDGMLKLADEALYEAKESGRNKVVTKLIEL